MAPAHTVLGLALLATRIRADETDDDATDSIFIDPDSFPDDWYGALQLTQLFLAYCVILYFGCNMISDGAELLMLTPYSKLVGAVILPILGAVPDGAIVLFSGIGITTTMHDWGQLIQRLANTTKVPDLYDMLAGLLDWEPRTRLVGEEVYSCTDAFEGIAARKISLADVVPLEAD